MSFLQRDLFGGAITCELPSNSDWRDASEVRLVPNNQEVFQCVSSSTDPSLPGPTLIVEILEYQQQLSGVEAGRYFFADLATANGITSPSDMLYQPHRLPASLSLPIGDATYVAGIGMQKIAHGRDFDADGQPRPRDPRWILIELCVVRLPQVPTDLLITLSQPSYEANPQQPLAFSSTFLRVVMTLHIHDWGLFG